MKIPVSSHPIRAFQYTLCGDFLLLPLRSSAVPFKYCYRNPSLYFTKLKRPRSLSLSTEASNPWQVSFGPSLVPSHFSRTEIATARRTSPDVATTVVSQGGWSLTCLCCYAAYAFGLFNFEHALLALVTFLFMAMPLSSGSLLSCQGPSLPSFVGCFCP